MNWLQRFLNADKTPAQPSQVVSAPDWMTKSLRLPSWAAACETHSHKLGGRIEVDTGAAMHEWLTLLGAPDQLTQYWIECAYQCVKLDLQLAIENSGIDPRTAGKPVEFNFQRADEFALNKFPPGDTRTVNVNGTELQLSGVELATNGREAREHYKRIRGRLPF